MAFSVYILRCADGSYYTGHTDNLELRIAEHQAGKGAQWTRSRLPVEHAWSHDFVTREEALVSERRIKGWSRAKKEALIAGDWNQLPSLAKARTIRPSTGSGRTVERLPSASDRESQSEGEGARCGEAARPEPVEGRANVLVCPQAIQTILSAAREAHPRECCGILLGESGTITHAVPTANVHPEPRRHFEIDPPALIDAHKAERAGGAQVLGYYHSHPGGVAEPSAIDRAQAAHDGKLWAIVAPAQGDCEVRFFRDGEERFEALSYAVLPR